MKVSKSPLKKVVDVVKRHQDSNQKETSQMVVQCLDGKTIMVYGRSAYTFGFHTLENLDGTTFSFVINPFTFLERLGGKDKEKTYRVEEREHGWVLAEEGADDIPVSLYEKDITLPFDTFTPLAHPEVFMNVLTVANGYLSSKTGRVESEYLRFGAKAAFTADPVFLNHYRLEEAFPFEQGFLHLDQLNLLVAGVAPSTKTVTSSLSYTVHRRSFVLKNEVVVSGKNKEHDGYTHYFMLKIDHPVAFPRFDPPSQEEEAVITLRMDADDINEKVKTYLASCKDFYLYERNGVLLLDPHGKKETDSVLEEGEGEHPITWLRGSVTTGTLPRQKFSSDAFRALFSGQKGMVTLKQVRIPQKQEEDLLVWRIHQPDRIVSVIGKTEPNYTTVTNQIHVWEKERQDEQERRKRSADIS